MLKRSRACAWCCLQVRQVRAKKTRKMHWQKKSHRGSVQVSIAELQLLNITHHSTVDSTTFVDLMLVTFWKTSPPYHLLKQSYNSSWTFGESSQLQLSSLGRSIFLEVVKNDRDPLPISGHTIYVWYICLHESLIFVVNVGKHTSSSHGCYGLQKWIGYLPTVNQGFVSNPQPIPYMNNLTKAGDPRRCRNGRQFATFKPCVILWGCLCPKPEIRNKTKTSLHETENEPTTLKWNSFNQPKIHQTKMHPKWKTKQPNKRQPVNPLGWKHLPSDSVFESVSYPPEV